jgi:hypothetical protein
MHDLLNFIFPLHQPTSFVLLVGDCFLWTGASATVVAMLTRFGWRRGKKIGDL